MLSILSILAVLVIITTCIISIYTICMYICGINIISIIRGDKLLTITHEQYIPKQQNTAHVASTKTILAYRPWMDKMLAEYDIDSANVKQWKSSIVDGHVVTTLL